MEARRTGSQRAGSVPLSAGVTGGLGDRRAPSTPAAAERPSNGRRPPSGRGPDGRPRTPRRPPPPGRFGGNRWRTILIPILVVLTIVVIFQATSGPGEPAQIADATTPTTQPRTSAGGSAAASPSAQESVADPEATVDETPVPGAVPDLTVRDADGHIAGSIASGALPAGADFVATGAGTWHAVPGTTPTRGTGSQLSTYTIEVEDGLLPSVEEDQAFAAAVDAILADPRSWIGGGQVSLVRIDSGDPDFRISLTSQMTIRSPGQCGWEIPLEASCYNGWAGRVFINNARWVRGAMSFNGDLDRYRSYAVNHEVGHALGMRHEACPASGAPAPVMMQQSWSTSDDDLSLLDPQSIPRDGNTCVANPYPYPGAQAPASSSLAPTAAAG